jgi:glutamate dehydrogenase
MGDGLVFRNVFARVTATLEQRLSDVLPASVLANVRARSASLIETGIPERLANRIAALDVMNSAMDIVRIARTGGGIDDVARVYFCVGARFGLDRLCNAGASIAAETPWQKGTRRRRRLASRVITESNGARGSTDSVDVWLASRGRVVEVFPAPLVRR